MQNGAFGWATSLSSSLAAQKVSWSSGVGYQASLTDLFLKKNSLPFGSGISQLAAASTYLEKMSSATDHHNHHHHNHQSDQSLPQHQHQQQVTVRHKCHHHHNDKNHNKFACHQCHGEYPVPGPSSSKSSSSSYSDHPHHQTSSSDKSPLQHQSPHSAPTLSPHHSNHMPPPAPGGMGPQPQHQQPPHPPESQAATSQSCRRNSNNNSASRAKNAPVKHFLCPVCHRTFTQKGNLKTHMMIHSGDKPYSCQICGKSFTQKGNVDTHMKIHTGEKDYSCRHCAKGFTQRGNLRTHERSVHTKEKPYACDVCGKCFSQKGNMMTHLRTHNKDDRFPCTLCGKTFSQKGNLKTHMQRHSGTLPARRYGPRSRQSRLNAAAARSGTSNQFPAAVAESRPSHGHKGPSAVDEESLSSVDHSLDGSGAVHSQSSQNLLSPPVVTEAAAVAHSALKHTTQSRDHHQHQHQQLQLSEQRNNPIAPIAVQFNPRFYSPNSTISAPLAHTATWLASGAAASAVAAGMSGSKARQYDSFLSSYAGFAGQHPGQHLTRLTLLPSATHAMDHQHQQHAGDEPGKSREGHMQSAEYGSQQPNPDFSQLLD